ncbi:hypothetical protein SLS56_006330 [Neofusicoccum ribis]|uniref:Uncharacterized protein n=1 Tax=Neofusicoccum ribis TaxID=45134 RepID=A0ABR3SRU8_9PEZI
MPSPSEENHSPQITVKIEPSTQEAQEPLIHSDRATPFNLDADVNPPVVVANFEASLQHSGALLTTSSQTSNNNFSSMDRDEYPIQDGRYDPSDEPSPKTAIHHKGFSAAERIAYRISLEILQIISETSFADEDVVFLRESAENALRIAYPKSVKIGLRGDSGTGKSSLVNSILGYDGIAPYGDDGEACTTVVQEFSKPKLSQQTACESEIVFLSPEARKATLKDWIQDYWDSQASGTGLDDEDFVDAETENEGASSTAIDALVSLFCDHEECKDSDAARKFLSTAKVRGDPRIIGQLSAWMDALLASRGVKGGHVTINAASLELLQDEVAPYLQRVNSEFPSPWPLVKLVRTHFDSPILS